MPDNDPMLAARLDRIEAAQADVALRMSRLESGRAAASAAMDRESGDNGKWMRIGVIVLLVLAGFWLLDEMPGPNLLDRIF